MRLTELEARFQIVVTPGKVYRAVDDLAQAHGVLFLCPKCFMANKGPVGTHSVLVWFDGRGVPEKETPSPRWKVEGTGLDDLTLRPSILLPPPCGDVNGDKSGWHGFITKGEATSC